LKTAIHQKVTPAPLKMFQSYEHSIIIGVGYTRSYRVYPTLMPILTCSRIYLASSGFESSSVGGTLRCVKLAISHCRAKRRFKSPGKVLLDRTSQ
jgi:hypothetical protein